MRTERAPSRRSFIDTSALPVIQDAPSPGARGASLRVRSESEEEVPDDAGVPTPHAETAAEQTPPPFLPTLWPADAAERRAFLQRTAVSWTLIAAGLFAYVQLLSALGNGVHIFKALHVYAVFAKPCMVAGGLLLALAYVTDVSHWPQRLLPLLVLCVSAAAMLFGFGVLLSADKQPEAPHVYWALMLPVLQTALKLTLLKHAPFLQFLRATAYGLALGGTVVLALWATWVTHGNSWDDALPELHERVHCPQNKNCVVVTFLWLGPVLAAGWCYALAAIAYFISLSPEETGRANAAKLLPIALLTSLLLSWVAAQIGPVQMRLADALQVMCGAGLASTGCIMCAVLGWERVSTHPYLLEALAADTGDWVRAILVSFLALPYVLFLPLSLLNQAVRKRSAFRALAVVPPEHARFACFTPLVAEQLSVMRGWNWSSVGVKSMRVALGFFCIIVGLQKLLTLFFVWFIAVMVRMPPGAAVAIFIGTGTGLLYCVPWMAAVPVYLAGGVVVTAAGQAKLGFWGAMGAAIAVSSLTKAASTFALHQILGSRWMKNAGARKDFELASVKMRAMEMILSRPGFDVAKLSMLVAGPDWLTGVLAGMLGTNVWHVLAAQTAPTALLIAGPATAAGAFLLRVAENKSFLSLCSLLLFFAAGGVGMVMFYYSITSTAKAHEEELKDKPNDREVEELLEIFEQTEAPLLRIVQERVNWHGDALPRWMRAAVITGSITMCIACTAVRYYGSKCFTRFQINDSVSCPTAEEQANPRLLHTRNCLGGNPTALVTTEGWVVLLLFFIGFACYRGYFYYCHRLLLRLKASAAVHPMPASPAAGDKAGAEEGTKAAAALVQQRSRPRARAANASTLDMASANAASASPLDGQMGVLV